MKNDHVEANEAVEMGLALRSARRASLFLYDNRPRLRVAARLRKLLHHLVEAEGGRLLTRRVFLEAL